VAALFRLTVKLGLLGEIVAHPQRGDTRIDET
jgi:hypothetical protein